MHRIAVLFLIVLLTCIGCSAPTTKQGKIEWEVSSAPSWENLFRRDSGWFGGDGIFFVDLPASDTQPARQLILFSDTMLGQIKQGKLQSGYKMINNSIAILYGNTANPDSISFPIPVDDSGQPRSIFPVSLESAEPTEYYWLGDGFYNHTNQKVYIFAYRTVTRPDWDHTDFKFEILGGALISFDANEPYPFENNQQVSFPFYQQKGQHYTFFGAGILDLSEASGKESDGYIYIYGTRDPAKEVLAARVLPSQFEAFDQWSFWDGTGWNPEFQSAQALADSASNELSVSRLPNGEYAMVFQYGGIYPYVGLRLGDSPIGPFHEIHTIWDCSNVLHEPEFFAYNAKGHPSISEEGTLVISYNVNSFRFWEQIEDYPQLYRPRFIKLDIVQ